MPLVDGYFQFGDTMNEAVPTFEYKSLLEYTFSFFLDKYLRMIAESHDKVIFNFLRNC